MEMRRNFGYVIILSGIFLVKNILGNHGAQFPPYWNLRSKSSSGAGFNSMVTRNMYQCQRLCWITPLCESVVFSVQSGMCTLFSDVPDVSELTYSFTHIGSTATKVDESKWMTPCRYKLCPSNHVCVVAGDTGVCLCSAVDCGTPQQVTYASVTYTTTTYNSSATYACVTGYNFTGSSLVSQCSHDATWTGLNGTCDIVDCGTPPAVTNANVTYTTTTYGAEAMYSCETGHNFDGASLVSECGSNGSWNGLGGTCDIVDCGAPPDLTNANVTYTTTTYGAQVLYSCDIGHNFDGTSLVSECGSNGSWIGLVGTCDIVTCPAPSDITNAQMTYSALTYASVTTYTCDPGFHFATIGQKMSITCLVTGQWSSLSSPCETVDCGTPPQVSYASVTYTTTTYNSSATYACVTGYNFTGSSLVSQCSHDATWTGLNGTCDIVDCDTPPAVTNANATYTTTTYGAEAMYSCQTGHNFDGASLVSECGSDGSWTGLVGTCEIVDCGSPPDLTNANVTYTTTTYGAKAVYSCEPVVNFDGTSLVSECGSNGSWNGLGGTCDIVDCGAPPDLTNANVTYTTTTYGAQALYSCDIGHNFDGTSLVSECGSNGSWIGLVGTCDIVTCPAPSDITNAQMTYSALTYASVTTYTCDPGFHFATNGQKMSITCLVTGQWSSLSSPCEVVDCGTPPDLTNANVTYTTTTYGAEAVYSCEPGHNFDGTSLVSECGSNGSWNGLGGTCNIVDCGAPPDLTNSNVTYTTTTYGAQALYSCDIGHNFDGTSLVSECGSNGSWIGFVGTCDIVTCPAPSDIANAQMITSALTYASATTYTCDPGFHFAAIGQNLTITCLVSGQWSSLSSPCENIKDCADILAADPTSVDGVYMIQPTVDAGMVDVYCDMTGGGWTVIQRREDGSVDFSRSWSQYRNGFGTLTGEFWLGNTAIYRLTNQQTYRLHIHLKDAAGDEAYAEYSSFHIEAESNKFRLRISGYSGTAGDSLVHYHDTMYFSTYDNDNDEISINCAVDMPGGWWYKKCLYANLNGQFGVNTYSSGINWESWRGYYQSLVGSVMKIKTV